MYTIKVKPLEELLNMPCCKQTDDGLFFEVDLPYASSIAVTSSIKLGMLGKELTNAQLIYPPFLS